MRSIMALTMAVVIGFGIGPFGAASTFAKVVEQEDDLFATRDSATVAADPEQTWLALIAPGKWWNDAQTWSGDAENMYLSPQGGGCFCELLPKVDDAAAGIQRGSVQHMIVVQADPGKVLRMRGGLGPLQSEPAEGVLTITLKPVKGGTRIVWEYVVGGRTRFEPEVIAKAVDGVMSLQLARLVKVLGAVSRSDGSDDAEEKDTAANRQAADQGPATVSSRSGETDDDAGSDDTGDAGSKPSGIQRIGLQGRNREDGGF